VRTPLLAGMTLIPNEAEAVLISIFGGSDMLKSVPHLLIIFFFLYHGITL
jgi:hypothetical protein